MAAIFVFLLMLALLGTQVSIGNFGLYLPLVPAGVFYITICYDWPRGALTAVVCGLVVDSLYGRFMPLTPVLYLAVVGMAAHFRSRYDLRDINTNIMPGFLIVMPSLAPWWISEAAAWNEAFPGIILNQMLPLTLFACLFGTAFLPLLILLADRVGGKLGLPRYLKAATEPAYEDSR